MLKGNFLHPQIMELSSTFFSSSHFLYIVHQLILLGLLDFQSNYFSPPPASFKTCHPQMDHYSSLITGLPASTLIPPLYQRWSFENTKSLFLGSSSGLTIIINTYTPTHNMCAPHPCSLIPAPLLHKWPILHADLWEKLSFVPTTAYSDHPVTPARYVSPRDTVIAWHCLFACCPPRWNGDPVRERACSVGPCTFQV